ncbi:MAG: MBL fold metallo-hydrolase [Clostridium sp.]|nr:MBL fold metallo-hydrolase [Clostridium sp.]
MNKNKIKKIMSIAMTAVLLTLGIGGCDNTGNTQGENKVYEVQDIIDAPVDITVMDAGKADCILIKLQDKSIMIDTGLNKSGEDIVAKLKENNIDTLDYLILTHMDKDHIGGADTVIDNIKINNLIQADYIKESKQYNQYEESLKENNITPVLLHENISTEINGAEINIYPAEKDYYEQSNDYSIIVELKYGKYNFLFAGDAEDERLTEFLSDNDTEYTFVKIPHHGRYDSMSKAFIQSTSPSYAVITCSEEEVPDEELLDTLEKESVKTYLTSEGEVEIKTDGKSISLNR